MEVYVTLFSRSECHLCDLAEADLETLQSEIPHTLMIVDIDKDPALQEKYGDKVPVLTTGPFTLEAPFTIEKLRVTLMSARDSAEQRAEKDGKRYHKKVKKAVNISRSDRFSWWFANHYMKALNLFIFLFVGLPFLAPVLMNAGLERLARPIYGVYGFTCHQLAYRSWFLFGEQEAYPRELAGVDGLMTFSEATGLGESGSADDLLAARAFRGNEQVGYKVAFCERDVAIYAAMLLFGLLYAATGEKIKGLSWLWWGVLGIMPIGLDGFSQLFSQMGIPPFNAFPLRESTPLLRTLTGAVFGFTTAWFGFPVVKESMEETRVILSTKFRRLGIDPDQK